MEIVDQNAQREKELSQAWEKTGDELDQDMQDTRELIYNIAKKPQKKTGPVKNYRR